MNDITKMFFQRQRKDKKTIMFSVEDSSEDSLRAFSDLLKENNVRIAPFRNKDFFDLCLNLKKETNKRHLIYFNIFDEVDVLTCHYPYGLVSVVVYPIQESYFDFPVSEKEILNLIT